MKKINLTEFIKKSSKSLSMTQSERVRMERVLSEYMQMKPMRNAPLSRRAPVQHFFLSVYEFSRKSVAFLLVGALVLSGLGATSYAAENALPGDILYPLKTQVNESVVAALSVSTEAKAEWNIERAERRLEEAAKLASINRLNEETEATLAVQFELHADAVVANVESLELEGSSAAAEIASSFETRLAAHEVVLEDVEHEEKAQSVRTRVRAKSVAVVKARERVEGAESASAAVATVVEPEVTLIAVSDVSSSKSVVLETTARTDAPQKLPSEKKTTFEVKQNVTERMAKSAKKGLSDAEKLFARVKGKLDADAIARIEEALETAHSISKEGDTAALNGENTLAFQAYKNSSAASGKLLVYLKAFQKLRIKTIPELRSKGTIGNNSESGSEEKEEKGRDTGDSHDTIKTETEPGSSSERNSDSDSEKKKRKNQ